MRGLSGPEMIRIWEIGMRQHPLGRAMTMLGMALPEVPHDTLLAMSVGQRDAHLLALREQTLGSQLSCFAECPSCQEQLEFTCNVSDIRVVSASEPAEQARQFTMDGYELHFRLPDTPDLAALVPCQDVAHARSILLQRCVLECYRDGVAVPVEELPAEVIDGLGSHMLECDPQAEVRLDLTCSVCGYQWLITFDIITFFWREICMHAKRLLHEVHTLAHAYGWREADILAMSAARREFYLELVT